MHKTFTDCYFAPGFTGGGWAYALNSNDADGEVISAAKNDVPTVLGETERRLAYYCIGWETIEVSGGAAMVTADSGSWLKVLTDLWADASCVCADSIV